MVSGCTRSEGFPGEKRPFPRKDKRDSHVRKIHHAALSPSVSSTGFTAAIANVRDNVVDTNGIAGVNESANNSGSVAAHRLFDEPNWLHGNSDSTAPTDIDTPLVTGLVTSADGSIDVNGFTTVDGQVGFAGFTGITASTSTFDALTSTNCFSFTDGFADTSGFSASGFTGTNGYTGADGFIGINELTSADGLSADGFADTSGFSASGFTGTNGYTGADGFIGFNELTSADGLAADGLSADGLTGADWPIFTDASTDEFPDVDGIVGANWFAGTTGFTGVNGLIGVGSVISSDICGQSPFDNIATTDSA